jgi:hypothetical protein
MELLSVPTASWPEAVAKVRYVLNLYAAGVAPADTHHRDVVAPVFADFARLSQRETKKFAISDQPKSRPRSMVERQ